MHACDDDEEPLDVGDGDGDADGDAVAESARGVGDGDGDADAPSTSVYACPVVWNVCDDAMIVAVPSVRKPSAPSSTLFPGPLNEMFGGELALAIENAAIANAGPPIEQPVHDSEPPGTTTPPAPEPRTNAPKVF